VARSELFKKIRGRDKEESLIRKNLWLLPQVVIGRPAEIISVQTFLGPEPLPQVPKLARWFSKRAV